jgi:hypothetical protein
MIYGKGVADGTLGEGQRGRGGNITICKKQLEMLEAARTKRRVYKQKRVYVCIQE